MINISKMTTKELEELSRVCDAELTERRTNEKKKAIEDFRRALETLLDEYNVDIYVTNEDGYETYIPNFESVNFDY